jgi:hypothetical protein
MSIHQQGTCNQGLILIKAGKRRKTKNTFLYKNKKLFTKLYYVGIHTWGSFFRSMCLILRKF